MAKVSGGFQPQSPPTRPDSSSIIIDHYNWYQSRRSSAALDPRRSQLTMEEFELRMKESREKNNQIMEEIRGMFACMFFKLGIPYPGKSDFSSFLESTIEVSAEYSSVDTSTEKISEANTPTIDELMVFDEMPKRKSVGNDTENCIESVANRFDELIVFEEMSENGSIEKETEKCTKALSTENFVVEVQECSTIVEASENVLKKENRLMINEVENDKFTFPSEEHSSIIEVPNVPFDQTSQKGEFMETKAGKGTTKDYSAYLLCDFRGWEVELLEGVIISVRFLPKVLRIRTYDGDEEDSRSTRVNIGLEILLQSSFQFKLLKPASNAWAKLLRPPPEPPPQGSRLSQISIPLHFFRIRIVREETFYDTSKICRCPCLTLFYCHYQLYTILLGIARHCIVSCRVWLDLIKSQDPRRELHLTQSLRTRTV